MSRVLIVEDNEKNLKLLRDLLQLKGYETVEARTGGEAVRMAQHTRPDLVLMDIQLPDIDGIEALRRIRADPAIAATAVVAVSASVMPEHRARIMTSGFNAYLTKPINVREFLALVARHFAGGGFRE
jgi:two-component system, cell cycle response regulator DivK